MNSSPGNGNDMDLEESGTQVTVTGRPTPATSSDPMGAEASDEAENKRRRTSEPMPLT